MDDNPPMSYLTRIIIAVLPTDLNFASNSRTYKLEKVEATAPNVQVFKMPQILRAPNTLSRSSAG